METSPIGVDLIHGQTDRQTEEEEQIVYKWLLVSVVRQGRDEEVSCPVLSYTVLSLTWTYFMSS